MSTLSEYIILDEENQDDSVIENTLHLPTFDFAIEVIVILVICVTIIVANVLAIATVASFPGHREVMDFYMLSLSFADLLMGLIVMPLSLAAILEMSLTYKYLLCSVSGYLHITLCAVCLYLFMWMAVDRYLAIRKSLRYDVIQTHTRCKCWVLFTWLTAGFLCCPPLLGNSTGRFYDDSYMCMLDVGNMLPYSVTLGSLVLTPSILTLCYTYSYIFSSAHIVTREDVEHAHTDHVTSFLLTITFCISWAPWGILGLMEHLAQRTIAGHTLRFCLLWMGELHAVWKPLILLLTSNRCKHGLRILCTSACCKRSSSLSM